MKFFVYVDPKKCEFKASKTHIRIKLSLENLSLNNSVLDSSVIDNKIYILE